MKHTTFPRWLAPALAAGLIVPALVQAQNNASGSTYGPCGAANGGGQNSTNYYSSGDPCAHVYNVPAERVSQLIVENPSCSPYSRTQVACSKPVKGTYGQTEMDRRAAAGGPQNRGTATEHSEGARAVSNGARGRFLNPGQKERIDRATQEIQKNPRDAGAYVNRAECYLEIPPGGGKPPLPNVDLAVADLEQALKLNPRNFSARHDYAHVAYLLGYQDFAISEFGKAIMLNPSSARSYLGRGWAYFASCRLGDAAADFSRTVGLDPSLQAKVAGKQYLVEKKNECAASAYAAAHPPIPAGRSTDNYLSYERQQANGRANQADANGNHEAARRERENVH